MSTTKPQSSFSNAQFDQPLMYSLYSQNSHQDLQHASSAAHSLHNIGAATTAAEPSAAADPVQVSLFSRSAHVAPPMQDEDEGGGINLSFAERFKRWSFEQERSGIANGDLQSFNMSPLFAANNEHNNILSSAAAVNSGGGSGITAEMQREATGRHVNLVGSRGSASAESRQGMGFLPLSSSNTAYLEAGYGGSSDHKPQYSTGNGDMEILRVNQAHNTASGPVHFFEDIPSPLPHHSIGLSASEYNIPYTSTPHRATGLSTPNFISNVNAGNNYRAQLLHDQHHDQNHHRQWGPSAHPSSAGNHPHAELLLLPGTVAESVVEASPSATTHNIAFPGRSKLDLLHLSSLHDKQAPNMLPLQSIMVGSASARVPVASSQMWHLDKLEMTVGLGLQENCGRSTLPIADIHHYGSTPGTQSSLSLFMQSPQQRAQTALTLDAARYGTRSASGSLGVLRNSKYLKAAQQLLNEFCSVCKDGNIGSYSDAKASTNNMTAGSIGQSNFWNATGGSATAAEDSMNIAHVGAGDDHGQLARGFFSNMASAATDKSGLYQLKSTSGSRDNQQNKTPTHCSTADQSPAAPAKQLPADERCHLQMRKARLVAMVEELDRRYQQYRDHMQLIVTSFESATGMGGAAPYTTLARRAMSKQFRGLRDVIGEHISAVCRLLGEEVSSVPILSRGETPRLRLVDQRLRHQRSLQQIGMLPQQQAWRPQRGLPERSVSVLRAWLFEHFLHPYPKDSEKAMLARLTGLSRNQVSNWFINARVRLWKPMIEEMYLEESKALDMAQGEGSAADANTAGDINNNNHMNHGGSGGLTLDEAEEHQETSAASRMQVLSWSQQQQQQQATLYNTNSTAAINDLNSFVHFHSAARGNDPTSTSSCLPDQAASSAQYAFSWMKPHVPAADAQHAGNIGNILTHHHHHEMQAAALMQAQSHQLSSTTHPNYMKNGVSLTLGLQQPPPHSTYNIAATAAQHQNYHVRPSEALLF